MKSEREKKDKEDVFAIRCFKNGKRRFTDRLTKYEARCLLVTARHLSEYLASEYDIQP